MKNSTLVAENSDWTNAEIPQSLFCNSTKANELLFEITSELRLGRTARSRREGDRLQKLRAVSHLRLVCVDGVVVIAPNESGALAQEPVVEVATLRAWLDKCSLALREP